MAFTNTTIWEVQTGGDDTNYGGGFDCGVSGFPTDGTVDTNTGNTATPIFSSASYNFQAGDVGAWIFIKSGTNSIPGFYNITAVSSNKATLNAAIGAALISPFTGDKNGCGANPTVGIATTGTPTNLTWGIDYSQSSSSKFTSTHFSSGASNTLLSDADNTIGKNWVGNIISITAAGTGFTIQRVAVVSTSGTVATVDKSLGGTGLSGGGGQLGGCLASPAMIAALSVTGNVSFCKAGTYSIGNTANVSGGRLNATAQGYIIGYDTHRYFGNLDTQPVWQASANSITMVQAGTGSLLLVNITLDGNVPTRSTIIPASNLGMLYCTIKNCDTAASNTWAIACYSTSNSAAVFSGSVGSCSFCEATGNTGTGFNVQRAFMCLSYSNTGASSDGFLAANNDTQLINCVAYANGRDGFRTAGATLCCVNCYSEGNTGGAFTSTGARPLMLLGCAYYNNGTDIGGAFNTGSFAAFGSQKLTASPLTNPGSGDFSLNNLSTAGALLRKNAYMSFTKNNFPRGLSLSYLDIGAVQHDDPASGVPMAIQGVI